MHKTLILTLPAAAMCLSSCVYDPAAQHYGEVASIWQRAPRYSVTPPPAQRYTPPPRGSNTYTSRSNNRRSTGAYNTYTGVNRYGSSSNPSPRRGYSQYEPGGPARLSAAQPRSSSNRTSDDSSRVASAPAPKPPQERRLAPELDNMASNTPPPGGFEPRETTSRQSDTLASSERKSSPPASTNPFSHLPLAVPVPGKAGYVTLPPPYTNSPEIDVRGIAPGTPVEIPDGSSPGDTIQFRVP